MAWSAGPSPSPPEQVIARALADSRNYLATLGHSYAGKWLDANARHFIARRCLDALAAAGYRLVDPPTDGSE